MRLFVAVCLTDAWHVALQQHQAALRRQLGPADRSLRWVRPEGCHLTLVFLGESAADALPRIEAALADAAASVRPFTLRLGQAGAFGGRQPRVLHVSVQGEVTLLSALQRRVASALNDPEMRPFSPHITLARVPRPDRASGEAIAAALALPTATQAPPFLVERISLMQSELRPGGAVYTELFAAPLVGLT